MCPASMCRVPYLLSKGRRMQIWWSPCCPNDEYLLSKEALNAADSWLIALCRAPALAESGEAGAEMWVDLEMRVVADVGIIGVPNAGKSSLLAVLSAGEALLTSRDKSFLLKML